MVLSRLILPATTTAARSHFHTKGLLLMPARRFCSSSSSSSSTSTSTSSGKSTKSSKRAEERAVRVESYVKKYMQTHPGVFPKASQVQNEVGGSWYLLKDILSGLKEKMFGESREKSSETVPKGTIIEVVETGESLDAAEVDGSRSGLQSSEREIDPQSSEKGNATSLISYVKLVETEDGYHQSKADTSAVMDTEEKATRGRDVKELSTDKNITTCTKLNGSCNAQEMLSSDNGETVSGIEDHLMKMKWGYGVYDDTSNGSSTAQQMSLADSGQKVSGLDELVTKMKWDFGAHDDTSKSETDNALKPSSDDSMKEVDVKMFLDRIKELESSRPDDSVISNKIDPLNNGGLSGRKSQGAVKQSDPIERKNSANVHDKPKSQVQQVGQMKGPKKRNTQHMEKGSVNDISGTVRNLLDTREERKVPFEIFNSQIMKKHDNKGNSGAASFDMKSKRSPKFPGPNNKASAEAHSYPLLRTEKGRDNTTVLVRFLQKHNTVKDLELAFQDCAPITDICFISQKDDRKYRDAYVSFKTKEGMQKALAKSTVNCVEVVLEPASPLAQRSKKICAPHLIADPDVPAAVVKHPTRTVMIKGLPHDVTSHHLKQALFLSGDRIPAFFMGSSNTVAYIEFETEDAKEKAIAASPISVSGRELSLLRIDTPLTTVVRISNVHSADANNIRPICSSYGEVSKVRQRNGHVYDVYFGVAEWPNMVNILNCLNGKMVNERRWIAQPATSVPLEILSYLWSQPDGKKQLYSAIQDLHRKFEQSHLSAAELKALIDQFCGERA